MPGIVGIIGGVPTSVARVQLGEMICEMNRDREYESGFRLEPTSGASVGWTCHANSFASRFPVQSKTGDIVLVVAGEVLPDADEPRPNIAPEAIIEAYEQRGPDFVRSLNGWFSGVVIDRRRRTACLFTDRYGMERLFCHQAKDAFYFASEAKALLRVLPECRDFEPSAVAEFLAAGCTLGERSLYKDVQVVPGATWMTFAGGALASQFRYFEHREWQSAPQIGEEEFRRAYVERFQRVVQRYTDGTGVALSLTGGLDSRMVISAATMSAGTLPCYTFGSMYRDTFDVKVSRAVASAVHQPYSVLVLGPEYVTQLSKYFERAVLISDGYMGFSGAAELYANEQARRVAPIRVTGNYGSELLRGVRAFKFEPVLTETFAPEMKPFVKHAGLTFAKLSALRPVSFAAFVQAPHQDYGRTAIERSQVTPRTPFMSNAMVALASTASVGFNGVALSEAVIAAGCPELLRIPTDRGYLGSGAAIARSVRRVHREALFRAEYWAGSGMPDWLVRQRRLQATLQLEARLLGWHKFDHYRVWMRQVQSYVQGVLLEDRSADLTPFVDRRRLTKMLEDHFNQRVNRTVEIDRLATLAVAKRALLSSPEPARPVGSAPHPEILAADLRS